MQTTTFLLFVMLQLSGPDPRDPSGAVPTSISATTAEFHNAEACQSALEKAYAAFGNKHVLVTAFCTAQ